MALHSKRSGLPARVPIDMTPMIDVVFQLLAFFCMTLKVVSGEGDFSIKMPLEAADAEPTDQEQQPPMLLRMKADAAGNLTELLLDEMSFDQPNRWRKVHNYVAGRVGGGSLTNVPEVVIDCDYGLKYENVIEAITAVSGSVSEDGQTIKLVEKISFAPPRQP
jgi:biopolymer transport protein ExbD